MQITPLGAGSLQPDRSGATAKSSGLTGSTPLSASRAVSTDAMPSTASATWSTASLPRSGLQVLQETRNPRIASAQQALSYLDRLAVSLQQLKIDLGSTQAGRLVPVERLEGQRQTLSLVWQQRLTAGGGQLDNQLRYLQQGTPVQGFTVRGLDANAVHTAAAATPETLTIAIGLPTTARPAARVQMTPQASAQEQARSVDLALQPLGLRAQVGAQGGLRFEVTETRWPQVSDQLAIQGEGRRFPAGRLHRVQTDADPAALEPQTLALDDGPQGRAALQQVITALQRTETARQSAQTVLAQARSELADQPQAQDAAWSQAFVTEFAAAAQDTARWREGSYGIRAALGAAVSGVDRQRVVRLLGRE